MAITSMHQPRQKACIKIQSSVGVIFMYKFKTTYMKVHELNLKSEVNDHLEAVTTDMKKLSLESRVIGKGLFIKAEILINYQAHTKYHTDVQIV